MKEEKLEGLKQLNKTVRKLCRDFNLFLTHDFHDLTKRVGRLSTKIIWIMGIYTVLNGIIWILITVLG